MDRHSVVIDAKGKASGWPCFHCSKQALDWATIHGRDGWHIDDYIPLCRKCHCIYDKITTRYEQMTREELESEMDRIEQIRKALNTIDGEGVEYDELRWQAAKGIWEELESGKSHRQLGQEIVKSHVYVGWYAKCWALVKDVYDEEYLPTFADIFYSTEVRGEGFKRRKDPKQDDGRRRGKKTSEEDYEDEPDPKVLGSNWIHLAMENLRLLEEWPAAWEFLTTEDLVTLSRIPGRARGIATQVKRRKGTAKAAKEVP